MPHHIALIMDGNRRWAFARGIPAEEAHLHTADALILTLHEAHKLKVSHLTFFCLSSENLNRPAGEVAALVKLGRWLFTDLVMETLRQLRIRVETTGNMLDERLEVPPELLTDKFAVDPASLTVTFAINYSSRQEIEAATLAPIDELQPGLAARIPNGHHPDVDLVIRTSGEQRLSNFMLWQSAFAELVFTDTLWPDFTGLHLSSAVAEYNSRRRRLGV